jgi:3-isopropylmalate/(R)-2-methylmalate dehydratase small subunit
MVQEQFEGKVWIIADENGKLIDDIDTDQIFHNSHLAITDINEMGQHAFGNLERWQHFAKEVQEGDIVVAGSNFGAGSSRQQAVDCFKSLGVACIICRSYGAIYKRNAINSGFPILTITNFNVEDKDQDNYIQHGDTLKVDLNKSIIFKGDAKIGELEPFSKVQKDIFHAGNIFEYAKHLK